MFNNQKLINIVKKNTNCNDVTWFICWKVNTSWIVIIIKTLILLSISIQQISIKIQLKLKFLFSL